METFFALLALCAGNSPVTGEFPAQRPVTRSFDVFFDLRLNIRLSKRSWGRWFDTPSCQLWRHCNVGMMLACEISLEKVHCRASQFSWCVPGWGFYIRLFCSYSGYQWGSLWGFTAWSQYLVKFRSREIGCYNDNAVFRQLVISQNPNHIKLSSSYIHTYNTDLRVSSDKYGQIFYLFSYRIHMDS